MEIQNGYKLGVYIKRIVFYVRDWIAICHVSSVLKMLLGWMGTYVNKKKTKNWGFGISWYQFQFPVLGSAAA